MTAGTGNILLHCEDPDEFEQAFNKLLGIHEPATPAEKDIVEEMVAARGPRAKITGYIWQWPTAR